jgi:Spy/CpxP family protein refolding chaperone
MKLTKLTTLAAVAAGTLALSTSLGLAQAPGNGGGGNGGNNGGGRRGGNGGNFDPAQFQQRMNERLKEALKATDEEWAVIQPLLDKVTTKQREARTGGFGGSMMGGGRRGGNGGPGGNNADQANTNNNNNNGGNRPNRGGAASPEADALRTTLENDNASADEIKTKLAALRDSRKKAQAELEQARADLEKVLTVKQEATLVLMGMLE